jgi:hypothetical protein
MIIAQWLKSYCPRSRLVLTHDTIAGLDFVDIGYALSAKIKESISSPNVAMIANEAFHEIIQEFTFHNEIIGDYVAITNWGILFERDLSFNLSDILSSLSRSRVLIAQNSGCVNGDTFYYVASLNKQYAINLSNVNYLLL